MKYKGTYRLKAEIDQSTNDYPRDDSGGIDPSFDDIYIKCYGGAHQQRPDGYQLRLLC